MVLDNAKEILSKIEIDPDKYALFQRQTAEEVTLEDMVNHLEFIIEIRQSKKGVDKVGQSRIGGDPDLAEGLVFPEDMYFYMQINLAEVKPHDRLNLLPDQGMLYVFGDEIFENTQVLVSQSDEGLTRTPYPSSMSVMGYMQDLLKPVALTFVPNFIFGIPHFKSSAMPFQGTFNLVPEEILKAMYATISDSKYQKANDFHCSRFYSSASDLQGETMGMGDYDPFDPSGGLFFMDDMEEEDDADDIGASFLFQVDFGDGHIFVGVPWGELESNTQILEAAAKYIGT